ASWLPLLRPLAPAASWEWAAFCKPVGNHIPGTVPPPMPAAGTCRLSPCSSHQGKAPLCRAGPIAPSPVTDVDECLDLASCPASATCTNTPGSHFCTCNTGFASSSGEQRFTEPAAQCNGPCTPSSNAGGSKVPRTSSTCLSPLSNNLCLSSQGGLISSTGVSERGLNSSANGFRAEKGELSF
ncbi:unnamed protein product, partial [Lepidochelys olivacea]